MYTNEFLIYLTGSLVTFYVMWFSVGILDKRYNICTIIRERFNIKKRSEVLRFGIIVVLILYFLPALVIRLNSNTILIVAGFSAGIGSGLMNRMNDEINQKGKQKSKKQKQSGKKKSRE